MDRARLLLTVDDVEGPRLPGDLVEGRVELLVDEAMDAEGVFVRLEWKTGKGANAATGKGPEVDLPGGRRSWKPGESAGLPFAVPVPAGPPTFRGKHLGVDWWVTVRAGIPWGFDPEESVPIVVGTPPALAETLAEKSSTGKFETGCALTCSVIFLLCTAVVALSRGFPGFPWVIAGILAGIIALFMVPVSLGRRRAGPVRLEAGPSPAAPGGEIAVRLTALPPRDFTPGAVRAKLVCHEFTQHGSGKSRTTKTTILDKVEGKLQGPETARAGREAVWAGVLQVPGDAPPSLEAGPHKIMWNVETTIILDWLPDPGWTVEVKVGG